MVAILAAKAFQLSTQVSSSTMVITGGEGSEALVTEYSGIATFSEDDGMGTKEVTLMSY